MTKTYHHTPQETEAVSEDDRFEPMAMLSEWNSSMGVKPIIEEPDAYGRAQNLKLRMRLITEEYNELMDEMLDVLNGVGDLTRVAKEAADLHYVLYGTEAVLEIPAYAVFREVHRSNMSKLGPDGKPVKREDGKILKGPNYSPADIEAILKG